MVARQEGAYLAAVDRSGELGSFQGLRKLIPRGDQECPRVSSRHSQPGIRGEASRSLRSAEVLEFSCCWPEQRLRCIGFFKELIEEKCEVPSAFLIMNRMGRFGRRARKSSINEFGERVRSTDHVLINKMKPGLHNHYLAATGRIGSAGGPVRSYLL